MVEPRDELGEGGDVTIVPASQPFGETIPDGLPGGVQVLPPGGGQGQHVAPTARPFSGSPAELSCSSCRDRVDLSSPKCAARSAARIPGVTSIWVSSV